MASPKKEVLVFYSAATGARLSGLTPAFTVYRTDTNTDLSGSAPAIAEIGTTGFYAFTPTFADPDRMIVYEVDGGATAANRYITRVMRPEDWYTDDIVTLLKHMEGRWRIHTSGGDANRLVIYDTDGTTPLIKFDLKDSVGDPTTINPFERDPV